MLPQGTVSRVYDYYFTAPRYRAEMKRALMEFLGDGEMMEYGGALFNEWFLFDFVLIGGLTPLEEFVTKNPPSLSDASLDLYRHLHENTYSLFEVMAVERKKGMTLNDARTGDRYRVEEDKATRSLHKGDLFFGRVAKVDDHYELVGADSLIFKDEDAEEARAFVSSKRKITPKEARVWMNGKIRGR